MAYPPPPLPTGSLTETSGTIMVSSQTALAATFPTNVTGTAGNVPRLFMRMA